MYLANVKLLKMLTSYYYGFHLNNIKHFTILHRKLLPYHISPIWREKSVSATSQSGRYTLSPSWRRYLVTISDSYHVRCGIAQVCKPSLSRILDPESLRIQPGSTPYGRDSPIIILFYQLFHVWIKNNNCGYGPPRTTLYHKVCGQWKFCETLMLNVIVYYYDTVVLCRSP